MSAAGPSGRKPRRKPKISLEEIEALRAEQWKDIDIARHYGVTRSYVNWISKEYGGSRPPRKIALDKYWPFDVPTRMGQSGVCRSLRDHVDYAVNGPDGMREDSLTRLRSLYERLKTKSLVVEFNLRLPPEDGVSPHGGWAYRDREPADGDLLIRVNEYTTDLDEDSRKIWSFPEVYPDV